MVQPSRLWLAGASLPPCLPYCLFSPPQTTLINLSRSREAKKADRNKSSDTYEGVIQQELHQVNRTCVDCSRKFIGMGCAGMMMRVSVWDGDYTNVALIATLAMLLLYLLCFVFVRFVQMASAGCQEERIY